MRNPWFYILFIMAGAMLGANGCWLQTAGIDLPPTGKICTLTEAMGGGDISLQVNEVLGAGDCSACAYTYTDSQGNNSSKATDTANCEEMVPDAGSCLQQTGDLTVPQQGCTVIASLSNGVLDPSNSSSNGCVNAACGTNGVIKARGTVLVWVQEGVHSVNVVFMTNQMPVFSAHCSVFVAETPPSSKQLADTISITSGWFTPMVSAGVNGYTISDPMDSCGDQSLIVELDFKNVSN